MGDAVADCLVATVPCVEEEGQLRGFWRLPPEIRTAIYEELLVTDCAFRLGHHGPYSHESRKQIHPAILRTCSQAYHEAVAILYGNNSFFLGPVGFKPTYSASFLTSIGHHNALRIRTIVAHCIHPHILTDTYIARWFSNLALDFPALKIIAISFSISEPKSRRLPSIPPQYQIPANMPVLGSQWPPSTPHSRNDSMKDDIPESEFEIAAVRNKVWLEKRKRSEVDGLVSLRNTDLRAGDEWLVYVSPAVKKRMGVKIW